MARILSRVLGSLATIYRPDSARQAPEQLDVSSPVQPVHDVSIEAALSAAAHAIPSGKSGGTLRSGLIAFGQTNVHAGAGTLQSSYTINRANWNNATAGTDYGWEPSKYYLELLALGALESAGGATCSSVGMEIGLPAQVAGNTQSIELPTIPLFLSTGGRSVVYGSGGYLYPPDTGYSNILARPLPVFDQTTLYFRSTATLAGTVEFWWLFRIRLR